MSTLKAKPPKTSTKSKVSHKTCKPPIIPFKVEYYQDMHTLRMNPISADYVIKFALEWMTAVLADEEIVTINRYPLLKGLQLSTINNWCDRVPEMKITYKHITDLIGDRREHLALHNKINSAVFLKGQHMYSNAWTESEIWRANLAAKVAGAGSGLTVIEVEKFANSDLVPIKKDKDGE